MTLSSKLAGLGAELRRPGATAAGKLFRITQRAARALHLAPAFNLARCVIVETDRAPRPTRGLADLIVRRGEERDVPALASVDGRDPAHFRARLARGDLVYLAQLDDEILCHSWLHRGPSSFDEERSIFARWALDDATFWSYDAMTRPEARLSGVAARLFEVMLRDVFAVHGARRVRGFIYDDNRPSLLLHERMGFTAVATVTALALPLVKWVRWESGATRRQWLLRRDSDLALPPAGG